MIKKAQDGYNLISTIDYNVQKIVEEEINKFDATYANSYRDGAGSQNTAIILMNPNNGEILAMADSTPYNLNDPKNENTFESYRLAYKNMSLQEMSSNIGTDMNQLKLDMYNSIWSNFCTTYTFEPGSTAKPFTIACGLEVGKLAEENRYECTGDFLIADRHIGCANNAVHGNLSIGDALANSCNIALAKMGLSIGSEDFGKFQNIFNLGLKTNIDITGEAKTNTLIHSSENSVKIPGYSFGGKNRNCRNSTT